jgi:hypothetical protein
MAHVKLERISGSKQKQRKKTPSRTPERSTFSTSSQQPPTTAPSKGLHGLSAERVPTSPTCPTQILFNFYTPIRYSTLACWHCTTAPIRMPAARGCRRMMPLHLARMACSVNSHSLHCRLLPMQHTGTPLNPVLLFYITILVLAVTAVQNHQSRCRRTLRYSWDPQSCPGLLASTKCTMLLQKVQ